VMTLITQTLVDTSQPTDQVPLKTIGPWFDRDKAEQYRQTRSWKMVEEAGKGYRRGVPSYPPKEILEIDGIRQQVEQGDIVIAAGGGGIPVAYNAQGDLEGVEAVIDTEQVASMIAEQIHANVLLMVIERDRKFILSGLSTESPTHLTLEELDEILRQYSFTSNSVHSKLKAASYFLHHGGEQVVITTLRKLPETLAKGGGLRIGSLTPSIDMFDLEAR
jgi:carbamate kinase